MIIVTNACLLIMSDNTYTKLKSNCGESSVATMSMAQETDPEQVFEVLERMGEG